MYPEVPPQGGAILDVHCLGEYRRLQYRLHFLMRQRGEWPNRRRLLPTLPPS